MSANKDEITEALRREITTNADYLAETERADLSKITLSFQSRMKPERHVWIDTKMGEDDNGFAIDPDGFAIDLEDWTYDGSWDNAVATVYTSDAQVARDVAQAWLRGEPLEECLQRCVGCRVARK